MGFGINGQVYLSFKVDGSEIRLGPSPQMKLFINQSCRQMLPVIKVHIPDFYNIFDKTVPINDGSVIETEFNDDQQAAFSGSSIFRTFGTPHRQPSAQFMQYDMNGLLDAIPYVRGNPPNSLHGASTDVLQNIAKAMNFNYNGAVTTDDVMRWLPGRHTWGSFAKRVALHGWASDKSALTTAVDEQRNLHYVDVNDLFANAPVKARIVHGGTASPSRNVPTYPAISYRAVNRSGMLNNWHGYGLRLTQNNILEGTINKFKNVNAMTVHNLLDMSKSVLDQIGGRARIDIPPLNTGNTHDNFMQARHNNLRLLSTYSQNVYVMVPMTTGLNLFDMVEFEANASTYTDESTTGIYSITNMTRALVNSRYVEKLELTTAGPGNSNSNLV